MALAAAFPFLCRAYFLRLQHAGQRAFINSWVTETGVFPALDFCPLSHSSRVSYTHNPNGTRQGHKERHEKQAREEETGEPFAWRFEHLPFRKIGRKVKYSMMRKIASMIPLIFPFPLDHISKSFLWESFVALWVGAGI